VARATSNSPSRDAGFVGLRAIASSTVQADFAARHQDFAEQPIAD